MPRLDHAAFETQDPGAAASFFARVFGARVVKAEGHPVMAYLDATALAFHETGGPGDHVAVRVSEEERAEVRRQLEREGVEWEERDHGIRRRRPAATVKLLAIAALCLATATACSAGGGEDKPVAHVGGRAVSTKQLDAVVSHFRNEAKREGRPFPSEGTTAFRQVRNHLLSLLVYREELQQAADRRGVKVSRDEVARRIAASSAAEPEGSTAGDTFAHDSVVAQLVYEGLFKKVTSTVHASTPAAAAAARNATMARFVARLERETKVRYEPGYAPGS